MKKEGKGKIQEFKDTFVISNGKGDKNSFFYFICYAIRYIRANKFEKCGNEELESDLPECFFKKLSLLRKKLVLDLNYQILEKQCYLTNDLLMCEKRLFLFLQIQKKIPFFHSHQFSEK